MATLPLTGTLNRNEISIPNKIQFLPLVGEFLRSEMQRFKLAESLVFDVQIAVDEAVTNIIQYAFPDGRDSKIDISCSYNANRFTVQIRDNGVPFDPTGVSKPELGEQLEERTEGGLGVMFMQELMDELHYEYKEPEGYEELTLVKKL